MTQIVASGCFLLAGVFLFLALGWYAQARRLRSVEAGQLATALFLISMMLLIGSAAMAAGW